MDLVASCKSKLAYFRIKELKDVLSQLGLAKQGKKQDLVDRILALVSDEQASKSHAWGKKNCIGKEGVAKIIDDTYRKMQAPGATDLASKSHSGSDLNLVKLKDEVADSYQMDTKVRCPCGSSLITESMIKCEDPLCQVWQHIGCVIIPENPVEGVPPEIPSHFYCEICRIKRADPFWVTYGHPLLPLKITSPGPAADGTTTLQNVDRTFPLSRADREMLQRAEYDLQVWCILLNDKVPFRMQWPQHADLQVNGVPIRITNRPGSQLLGFHGRDDGPVITTCSREGINKILLSRIDARVFCFGIRIAKRRTLPQVLGLVPKEADGERLEDALARIHRCIGGGATTENADSDSDLEVVADSVTVNLRCPMSGSRMRIAGRFKPCPHMGCFDLEAFVELNQRSRKWQCPICLMNYSVENVIIDPYFNRITSMMLKCNEDVTEVDIKPDGCWRAKNEAEFRELAQWHLPDGSLCSTSGPSVKPELEPLRLVKQEATSEGHTSLKIGIKRNRNGTWVVSKPDDRRPRSSGNPGLERFGSQCPDIILPMSSSATGSYRDGEDPSVNQDGGLIDLSVHNSHELDSLPMSFEPIYGVANRALAPSKDADVIVLSDTEDDDDLVPTTSSKTLRDTVPTAAGSAIPFPAVHVSERFSEEPATGTSLFNNNGDDFPIWSMPSAPPGFQLFTTNIDIPDPLVSYDFASAGDLEDDSQVQNICVSHSNTEIRQVDTLAFVNDDPSLQIFLPSRSPSVHQPAELGDHTEMPGGDHSDDWTSLRLSAGGNHNDSTRKNGPNSSQQGVKDKRMESLADTASMLLLSMNGDKSKKVTPNGESSNSPFSPPRQPRSVRPRLYLSIATDSD